MARLLHLYPATQSRRETSRPLPLSRRNSQREMLPSSDAPDEASQHPLPPQQAEERDAVLPELGRGEQRRLDGVGAHHEQERPVLDLCGRLSRLGGLDEGLVEDGARGDEGAPRDERHQRGAEGVAHDPAGLVLQGEGGDLGGFWVLG